MYRIQIIEGGKEKYWTNKMPMEFDSWNDPLSFPSEAVLRTCFRDHFPLFARYIQLSKEPVQSVKIVKIENGEVVEKRNFF